MTVDGGQWKELGAEKERRKREAKLNQQCCFDCKNMNLPSYEEIIGIKKWI
jgi:hypothetical protein